MDSLQFAELQTILDSSSIKGEPCYTKKMIVEPLDCQPLDFFDSMLERTLDLSEFRTTQTTSTTMTPSSFAMTDIHNNMSHPFSSGLTTSDQHQSLPQVVLDATTLVQGDKYPGEGTSLSQHRSPVAPPHFLTKTDFRRSPDHQDHHSDVTSFYSDDSDASTQQMPEFSQLTSPHTDFPSTSSFQFPSFGHLKREELYTPRTEDFGLNPCQLQQQQQNKPQQLSLSSNNNTIHTNTNTNNLQRCSSSLSCSVGMDLNSSSNTTNNTNNNTFSFVTSPGSQQSLPSPSSTIYSASSPGTPGPSTPSSGRGRRPHGCSAPYSTNKTRRRHVEKGTLEYTDKRARNNVAVRKSRAKAKQKQRETEGRVQGLIEQNEQLQKKVDHLSKELNVLKGLFLNIGASIPDDFLKLVEDS